MAELQTITETVIQDSIIRAVNNVSQTMMQRDSALVGRTDVPAPEATYELIGSVGFAGDINGIVYLCLTDSFAKHATGQILGMTPGEVEINGPDVVKDAIGEITNMTAGGFKNQLCDMGFPCKLTLPTIVRGKNLAVAAIKSATRHVFTLTCDGHQVIADIQLKAE